MYRRALTGGLAVLTLSGCIIYQGDRQPNLVVGGYSPATASAPRIEVVLHHVHTMDGSDAGGTSTDLTYKEMKESFERVRGETPFLANAAIGTAKPEYVLDLDTEVAEHGKTSAIVTGATLMIIPGFFSSDVIVRASLKDADGESLGHYEAKGQLKMVVEILLLPALPIALFAAPGKELYDDTFKDVLLQLGPDLDKHARAE